MKHHHYALKIWWHWFHYLLKRGRKLSFLCKIQGAIYPHIASLFYSWKYDFFFFPTEYSQVASCSPCFAQEKNLSKTFVTFLFYSFFSQRLTTDAICPLFPWYYNVIWLFTRHFREVQENVIKTQALDHIKYTISWLFSSVWTDFKSSILVHKETTQVHLSQVRGCFMLTCVQLWYLFNSSKHGRY